LLEDKTPFFSAVIPVYNKGPHVARAIRSVLAQTCQNFELLLIDDASTDESLEEMQKFRDPRIRILHRDTPGPGGYAARNLGIREAKAEWVAFLDADDEWYPEHLEKMRELIQSYPHVKFFSCGWDRYEKGEITRDLYHKKNIQRGRHEISCQEYLLQSIKKRKPVWTGVVVLSKTIPFASTLFPDEKEAKRGGDLHAWLKLICSLKTMAWSPHIGAIYHRDSVNMVTKDASVTYDLLDKDAYLELSTELNFKERRLLKKCFNRKIIEHWKINFQRGKRSRMPLGKLHIRRDLFYTIFWLIVSIFPTKMIVFLNRFRKGFCQLFIAFWK
jgi:glycosyltransferase involved in cell wall biosynthesis